MSCSSAPVQKESTNPIHTESAKTLHLVRWAFNVAKTSILFAANTTSLLSKTTHIGTYSTHLPTPRPSLLAALLRLPTLDRANRITTPPIPPDFHSSTPSSLLIFLWILKAALSASILFPRQLPQDAASAGSPRNPTYASGSFALQKRPPNNHPALCNR